MTACICSQHGDLECPTHPDCFCGCPYHAHEVSAVTDGPCCAGLVGCGCRRYASRKAAWGWPRWWIFYAGRRS